MPRLARHVRDVNSVRGIGDCCGPGALVGQRRYSGGISGVRMDLGSMIGWALRRDGSLSNAVAAVAAVG